MKLDKRIHSSLLVQTLKLLPISHAIVSSTMKGNGGSLEGRCSVMVLRIYLETIRRTEGNCCVQRSVGWYTV